MSLRTDRIRVYAFLKRKEGLSIEEFRVFWLEKHGQTFKGLEVVKKNLTAYEQVHLDHPLASLIASKGKSAFTQFDGMAVLEGESYEKVMAIFEDEEYKRLAVPEEQEFIDMKTRCLMPARYVDMM